MSEAAVVATPVVAPAVPATQAVAPVVVVPPVPSVPPGQPAPSATEAKGAPETYTAFKAADGISINQEAVSRFDAAAKLEGFTQTQRDAAIKFQTEFVNGEIAAYEAKMAADEAARPAAIQAAIARDPFLGGKDTVANVATMQRAVVAFGGAEFNAFLDRQQPDTYLQFAKFALRVGQAIKEDSVAGIVSGVGETAMRPADILFGPKTN